MNPVIVLAHDGAFDADVVRALAREAAADVVTMTIDIGQSRDVRAVRDLALAAGAVRAHLVDAMDDFVRACVLPALQSRRVRVTGRAASAKLAYPLIAMHLVEIAKREQTSLVAHGGGLDLTAAIHQLDPTLQVLTVDPSRQGATTAFTASRHLLQRPVADPSVARGVPANVEIEFDASIPVAINGVSLTLAELMESLSLLGGQHGIGHAESADAPGALVLEAAYRALVHESGVVRLELLDGQQRVLSADRRTPALVTHA